MIKIVGFADTIILHFAFCILHLLPSAADKLKFAPSSQIIYAFFQNRACIFLQVWYYVLALSCLEC